MGVWGDLVVILRNGICLELRVILRFREIEVYINDKMVFKI